MVQIWANSWAGKKGNLLIETILTLSLIFGKHCRRAKYLLRLTDACAKREKLSTFISNLKRKTISVQMLISAAKEKCLSDSAHSHLQLYKPTFYVCTNADSAMYCKFWVTEMKVPFLSCSFSFNINSRTDLTLTLIQRCV